MGKKSKIIKFWRKMFVVALVVTALQFLLSYIVYADFPPIKHILGHIFVLAITGLGYMLFERLRYKLVSMSGFIFGGIGMFKAMFVVAFLLPVLLNSEINDLYFVLQFIAIYLIYLSVEVVILVKDMK
jgi:RsiW-degrading membrane proteinase PrsW (M82 family)